jgi:hypothetical protein
MQPATVCRRCERLEHVTRRMLQALDAYWLHCDGLPRGRHPRGRYDAEEWWGGGSDIALRQPLDEWACMHCVDRLQSGVNAAQLELT